MVTTKNKEIVFFSLRKIVSKQNIVRCTTVAEMTGGLMLFHVESEKLVASFFTYLDSVFH